MTQEEILQSAKEELLQSTKTWLSAFDSEFIKDEYLIPEGCEARIEGNKVIIEKVQKEEELTEFEKMLRYVLECYSGYEFASKSEIETLKLNAKPLLDLARKEILKDLPKWKKGTPPSATTLYVIRKGYYMPIKEVDELFEILPKEE